MPAIPPLQVTGPLLGAGGVVAIVELSPQALMTVVSIVNAKIFPYAVISVCIPG